MAPKKKIKKSRTQNDIYGLHFIKKKEGGGRGKIASSGNRTHDRSCILKHAYDIGGIDLIFIFEDHLSL